MSDPKNVNIAILGVKRKLNDACCTPNSKSPKLSHAFYVKLAPESPQPSSEGPSDEYYDSANERETGTPFYFLCSVYLNFMIRWRSDELDMMYYVCAATSPHFLIDTYITLFTDICADVA
jgi:hypothetical protein